MSGGELVFVGIPGTTVEPSTAALLAEHRPGGVVLFRRNLEAPEQVLDLVTELRRLLPDVVLAVDAEGGRVDRLAAVVAPAPAAELLARREPAAAQEAGHWIALALRLFDLDVDFAPVVDLDFGERDNALDGRYLGSREPAVTRRARAFLRGLHSGGIGGCVKHFPGLGAAAADTHFETSVVRLGAAKLVQHLKPFASLLPVAGAAMIAHAVYPALDAEERPASLSPAVIETLLRGRMGFDGLVFSDDLDMKALAPWGSLPERAEAAFAAGCDVLLSCQTLEALPAIASRLAKPKHAVRRAQSEQRLEGYRRRLRTLRWTSDSVSLVRDRSRMARLDFVRDGLRQLLADLEG
jgi:beta-N-acetylhexosaminidase